MLERLAEDLIAFSHQSVIQVTSWGLLQSPMLGRGFVPLQLFGIEHGELGYLCLAMNTPERSVTPQSEVLVPSLSRPFLLVMMSKKSKRCFL